MLPTTENNKSSRKISALLGSLIEALYDSVPKRIRNAEHKTLLVALALKDLQSSVRLDDTF